MDANLFNVATSRAKKGTLIVTYQHIDLVSQVDNETMLFLSGCRDVSIDFIERFNVHA